MSVCTCTSAVLFSSVITFRVVNIDVQHLHLVYEYLSCLGDSFDIFTFTFSIVDAICFIVSHDF